MFYEYEDEWNIDEKPIIDDFDKRFEYKERLYDIVNNLEYYQIVQEYFNVRNLNLKVNEIYI